MSRHHRAHRCRCRCRCRADADRPEQVLFLLKLLHWQAPAIGHEQTGQCPAKWAVNSAAWARARARLANLNAANYKRMSRFGHDSIGFQAVWPTNQVKVFESLWKSLLGLAWLGRRLRGGSGQAKQLVAAAVAVSVR